MISVPVLVREIRTAIGQIRRILRRFARESRQLTRIQEKSLVQTILISARLLNRRSLGSILAFIRVIRELNAFGCGGATLG